MHRPIMTKKCIFVFHFLALCNKKCLSDFQLLTTFGRSPWITLNAFITFLLPAHLSHRQSNGVGSSDSLVSSSVIVGACAGRLLFPSRLLLFLYNSMEIHKQLKAACGSSEESQMQVNCRSNVPVRKFSMISKISQTDLKCQQSAPEIWSRFLA